MPKVSVIIPCYNQGSFIEEAINSVRAQSFSDTEIIIINDGSNDVKTNELLTHLIAPDVTIIHTENRGVAAARNTGIKAAKGAYILPLDGDDLIGKDYLKNAVSCLDAQEALKVVYCNAEYFGDETGPICLPDYEAKKMLQQNLIFCTALYRRSDWLELGGYDEKFLTGWEDWEFWLRLINNEKQVHKLPGVHFYYRIKKGSRNATLQNERLQQAEQQLYNKHIQLYTRFYPKPISVIRNYEALLHEQREFENYKQALHNSLSYRMGDLMLAPAKYLRNLIRSSK